MHQSGFRAGRLNPKHTGQMSTIEKTGKGLKAQGCLAQLMLAAGLIVLGIAAVIYKNFPEMETAKLWMWGGCLTAFAVFWKSYIRSATWWRHG